MIACTAVSATSRLSSSKLSTSLSFTRVTLTAHFHYCVLRPPRDLVKGHTLEVGLSAIKYRVTAHTHQ